MEYFGQVGVLGFNSKFMKSVHLPQKFLTIEFSLARLALEKFMSDSTKLEEFHSQEFKSPE